MFVASPYPDVFFGITGDFCYLRRRPGVKPQFINDGNFFFDYFGYLFLKFLLQYHMDAVSVNSLLHIKDGKS